MGLAVPALIGLLAQAVVKSATFLRQTYAVQIDSRAQHSAEPGTGVCLCWCKNEVILAVVAECISGCGTARDTHVPLDHIQR